jgi:hypothetical protein
VTENPPRASGPGDDQAADSSYPLSHGGQPETAGFARCGQRDGRVGRWRLVGDSDHQLIAVTLQQDLDESAGRMAACVGERLLDDAVSDVADGVGDNPHRVQAVAADPISGAAGPVDELRHVAKRGLRRQLRLVLGPLQHAQHRSELVERPAGITGDLRSTARSAGCIAGSVYGAVSARTAISEMWCATTSCRSLASRARSACAEPIWRTAVCWTISAR